MNKTKLRVLADAIEAAPEATFDMATWFSHPRASDDSFVAGGINAHCGTAGCIAGWVCNVFLPPGEVVKESAVNATALGLLEADTPREYEALDRMFRFSSYWVERGYFDDSDDIALENITKEMAVTELRRLAAYCHQYNL